jgi:DNA invertase Pin-like site-specific DNA recombinase
VARLYSYIRFSTPEQAQGTSSVRQAEYAANYAAEHNLDLDHSLSMRDEGLSAYHQHHIKQGALGVFLRAVDNGLVPEGSTLIIEALDRLSRAEPIVSQALLSQIINAGITVVTASDGKSYDRESLRANPMDLVYSLLVLIRAHEESDTKSKRVSAAIRISCEDWISNKKRGHIRNGRAPAWLKETGNTEPPLFEIIPERLAALHKAIELYGQGYGGGKLAQYLNDKNISYTGKPIAAQHFYKIIQRMDLIGTKVVSAEGQKYHLEDYYPSVLNQAEFDALQSARRTRPPSSKGTIVSILTGIKICRCGYCGESMAGINYIGRAREDGSIADGHRRLICNRHNNYKDCPVGSSSSIVPVERAIVEYCTDQLDMAALMGNKDEQDEFRKQLQKLESEIAQYDKQIDKLTEALLQTDTPPLALMRKQRELEGQRDVAEKKRIGIGAELRNKTQNPNSELLAEWHSLAGQVKDLDTDTRTKVRTLVSKTFERIEVYIRGFSVESSGTLSNVAALTYEPRLEKINTEPLDLVLKFKSGEVRLLRINKKTGGWFGQLDF